MSCPVPSYHYDCDVVWTGGYVDDDAGEMMTHAISWNSSSGTDVVDDDGDHHCPNSGSCDDVVSDVDCSFERMNGEIDWSRQDSYRWVSELVRTNPRLVVGGDRHHGVGHRADDRHLHTDHEETDCDHGEIVLYYENVGVVEKDFDYNSASFDHYDDGRSSDNHGLMNGLHGIYLYHSHHARISYHHSHVCGNDIPHCCKVHRNYHFDDSHSMRCCSVHHSNVVCGECYYWTDRTTKPLYHHDWVFYFADYPQESGSYAVEIVCFAGTFVSGVEVYPFVVPLV